MIKTILISLLVSLGLANEFRGGFGPGETDEGILENIWRETEHMKEVTNDNYVTEVVQSDKPWLLLFKKQTDFMSQKARDVYHTLAMTHKDINFGFVDIHKNENLKMTYTVATIPRTFYIDVKHNKVYMLDGYEYVSQLG